MPNFTNTYEAPITLGFTPADGDLIRGTVNGVEVKGQWNVTGKVGHAALYRKDNKNVMICEIVFEEGQAFVSIEQESAPTTDYELHLYRYVPAGIVKIPQEYVDGLEDTTANTNQALEKATAAQSTADTAKSTAESAQSTANSIKPDWKVADDASRSYIANRPFYHDIVVSKNYRGFPQTYIAIEGTDFYKSDPKQPSTSNGLLNINSDTTYVVNGAITTPTKFRINYSYEYAIGNPYLIVQSGYASNATLANGEPLPDTGEDWVYFQIPSSANYIAISKKQHWTSDAYVLQKEEIKKIDDEFIPDTIQRVGGDVIINSSTPDSTKKFKITVDDTGAISATEVT